jgi:membrane-bound metal-dependent hydrolase YbcI (DUF457 family)
MGPGCAVKAVAGDSFSLTVFGFAQITMDVEPLVRLFRGDTLLHGFSHTFLGGTVLAALAVLVGRPVCQRLLDVWTPAPDEPFLKWLRGQRVITLPAALSGALIGTFSHVVLDAILHADVQPFVPFWPGNPLRVLVSFEAMHLLCAGIGLLGCLGLVGVYLLGGRSPGGPRD